VSGKRAVALTFDDGPDPLITPALLDTLKRHRVNATFFVTGRRAAANRDLVVQILSAGHSIGNHSYHHFPLLMLKSRARLQDEILSAQSLLSEFGISPLSFRPPVGITSPRLGQVLQDAGLICVNFSCRGYDAGNRFIERLSINILKKVKPDDIILLHDSAPSANFNLNKFLHEIEIILTGLREKKLEVLPLSELIGKDIMKDCS
jgi:peptidoglycan/xylan/chitin deacetylase (PgdA/CDA1 family)